MREFGFELQLCAHLEATGDLVSRQLGGGVHAPSGRILDVVAITPGPRFAERAAITPYRIPDAAIRADVGPGRAKYWKDAFRPLGLSARHAKAVVERAVEIGFFERDRRNGRDYIRQVTRYPDDWFGRIRAIENKPDLDRTGALQSQLRRDVTLGLADEIVLATASYVSRAHVNRLPSAVGVWRFRNGGLEVIREATRLCVEEHGIEITDEHPGATSIKVIDTEEKAQRRRHLAETAYGKGWRTYEFPPCTHGNAITAQGQARMPYCTYHDRIVNPTAECGTSCPGFRRAAPPAVDSVRDRDMGSVWIADPPGHARRQTRLTRFSPDGNTPPQTEPQ